MSNTIMSTIYNHYMTTYAPRKTDARLDSHNKNELKSIYNNILKLNKDAPLYIYDRTEQTASFALSLKENTRQLQHTILNTAGNTENTLFKNKVAFSSDEDIISVKYIGKESQSSDFSDSYEIEVQNIATSQINTGYALPNNGCALKSGSYSFDVNFNNLAYEFQFNVSDNDTNYDIQTKLARLFNHANIGLNASVISTDNNTSSLRIESNQVGTSTGSEQPLFTIRNTTPNSGMNVVDVLGIDYIAREASNAQFSVNGEENNIASNHFIIDDTFEITMHDVTPDSGEPVVIGLKANIDSLKDNIYNLIGGYNTFLQAVDEYKTVTSSNKLSFEMQSVAKLYRNELDTIGINITDSGALSIDDQLLVQTAESEEAYDLLSPLKDFSSSLYNKGEDISRDPLNYAKKRLVAYKNPGKNFTSPYAASNYSGLLFNYYC